jgi:hypothetical protein
VKLDRLAANFDETIDRRNELRRASGDSSKLPDACQWPFDMKKSHGFIGTILGASVELTGPAIKPEEVDADTLRHELKK